MYSSENEIKNNVELVKALISDINDYKSFDPQRAYESRLKKRVRASQKRRTLRYNYQRVAAILLLPLMISLGVLYYMYIENKNSISYLEANSAPGTITKVLLPDSSVVWLNANSTLRYPSQFVGSEREVQLVGEGYFHVTSSEKFPFYVSVTNGLKVKAYGTKFNVSAYEEEKSIRTTLESGCVEIQSSSGVLSMIPNDQVVYDRRTSQLYKHTIRTEEVLAWKEGKMIFRNASLEEILKQMSRRYNIEFVLHKNTDKKYQFRAVFSSETPTQVLDYLKLAAPIKWSVYNGEPQNDYTYSQQRIDVWLY